MHRKCDKWNYYSTVVVIFKHSFEWLVWMSKQIEEEFVSVYFEMTGMADLGYKWRTFTSPYIAVAIL